jgi:hypothetical protein
VGGIRDQRCEYPVSAAWMPQLQEHWYPKVGHWINMMCFETKCHPCHT